MILWIILFGLELLALLVGCKVLTNEYKDWEKT